MRVDYNPFEYNSEPLRNTIHGIFLGFRCGFAAINSELYYNPVPFVINSGCTRDSRGLFGPSGADQRKAQGGCQNGQLWLDALWASPTVSQPGDK